MQVTPHAPSQKPSRDWINTQRVALQRLLASIRVRNDYHPKATELAEKLSELLKTHTTLKQPPRPSSVRLIARLIEDKAGLSFKTFAAMALELYRTVRDELPRQGTPDDLGDIDDKGWLYENRPIRNLASRIEDMAKILEKSPDAEIRRQAQALWFCARILSISAPPVQESRLNECVYCHRHTDFRSLCHVHRIGANKSASPLQKKRFSQAMEDMNKKLDAYGAKHAQEIDVLISSNSDAEVISAMKSVGSGVLSEMPYSTLEEAITTAGEGEGSLHRVASIWHLLKPVDDEVGLQQLEESMLADGAELMAHLVRFEAYQMTGGDSERKRSQDTVRKVIKEGAETQKVLALRATGFSRIEVAKLFSVAVTQIKKVEVAHGGTAGIRLKRQQLNQNLPLDLEPEVVAKSPAKTAPRPVKAASNTKLKKVPIQKAAKPAGTAIAVTQAQRVTPPKQVQPPHKSKPVSAKKPVPVKAATETKPAPSKNPFMP